jgi:hypothetical protein
MYTQRNAHTHKGNKQAKKLNNALNKQAHHNCHNTQNQTEKQRSNQSGKQATINTCTTYACLCFDFGAAPRPVRKTHACKRRTHNYGSHGNEYGNNEISKVASKRTSNQKAHIHKGNHKQTHKPIIKETHNQAYTQTNTNPSTERQQPNDTRKPQTQTASQPDKHTFFTCIMLPKTLTSERNPLMSAIG